MGREDGGEFRMGNTCIPVADAPGTGDTEGGKTDVPPARRDLAF